MEFFIKKFEKYINKILSTDEETLYALRKLENKVIAFKFINTKILILKIILVSILIIVASASLPFLVTSGHTHFKHALEWNYFVGVILFYLLSFLFWKKN